MAQKILKTGLIYLLGTILGGAVVGCSTVDTAADTERFDTNGQGAADADGVSVCTGTPPSGVVSIYVIGDSTASM